MSIDKTIYFIRHGQTDYNKNGIIQGGGIDSSLNDYGRAQAQAFFDYYQNVDFDLLISSALKRTQETISPFIKTGLPWEKHANINEMNWGIHEGKKYHQSMRASYVEMISQWDKGNYDARLEEGESAQELADRVTFFLRELKLKDAKTVLVCTHGRTMRCLISLLKGQHLREMEKVDHKNTCLYKAHLRNGNFELELENDHSHFALLDSNAQS